MITQTFEDMLFHPESEGLKVVPSPEELMYRIIISTKPPKEYLTAKSKKGNRDNSLKEKDFDEDDDHMVH
jgi:phosphatidylinositol phospholipase C delta